MDVNLALGHALTIDTGIILDQPSVEAQGQDLGCVYLCTLHA